MSSADGELRRSPRDRPGDGDGRPGRVDGLEVPVGPLGGSRRRLRGRVAALAVGTSLAVVVGVALAGGAPDGRRDSAVVPASDAPASDAPARSATAVPSASPSERRTPVDERPEMLPQLASTPLPGSPVAVFHGRRNHDLLRFGWSGADTGLRRLSSVPGAFDGFGGQTATVAVASPTADTWAIRGLGSFGGGPGDRIRLVTVDGTELWSATDGEGSPIVPIWSPDATRVAVPGADGTWRVVPVSREGVAGPLVAVDAREYLAGTLEIAGFSVDARWLYTIEQHVDGVSWRPVHRVSTATGRRDAITALPIDGPEALAVEGRLSLLADPLTGRRYASPSLALSTGPTEVEVSGPDGVVAFAVELDTVMGLAWAGDGRLLALEADHVPQPGRVRLVTIDESGRVGEPLLETGPLTWAGIVGVRDGHVLLGFSTSGFDGEGMLAMLRLEDGATATLPLDLTTFSDLQLGGWVTAG